MNTWIYAMLKVIHTHTNMFASTHTHTHTDRQIDVLGWKQHWIRTLCKYEIYNSYKDIKSLCGPIPFEIYIYIYATSLSVCLSLSLCLFLYIYIYICVCVCVCVCARALRLFIHTLRHAVTSLHYGILIFWSIRIYRITQLIKSFIFSILW